MQEQEEAKLKAEKRRREDKEYDVQWLQMQDDYLKLQEEKRIQERKRREDRVSTRMQIMKETGKHKNSLL